MLYFLVILKNISSNVSTLEHRWENAEEDQRASKHHINLKVSAVTMSYYVLHFIYSLCDMILELLQFYVYVFISVSIYTRHYFSVVNNNVFFFFFTFASSYHQSSLIYNILHFDSS